MSLRPKRYAIVPVTLAFVLVMGLTARPSAAGGHHYGKQTSHYVTSQSVGHYVVAAQPLVGTQHSLIPVSAGFVMPMSSASYFSAAPATAGYSYYSQPVAGFATTASYYTPVSASSSFAGLTPASFAVFTPANAGFSQAEAAAYTNHPTLASYLGASFGPFHRALVSRANTLHRTNGIKGGNLLKILKEIAPGLLQQFLPNIPIYGPIIAEVLKLVESIAPQVDPTATTASEPNPQVPVPPENPTTIIVNLTLDKDGTKLTAKATVDPTSKENPPTRGREGSVAPDGSETPENRPGVRPASPGAFTQPEGALNESQSMTSELNAAIKSLKQVAANLEDASKKLKDATPGSPTAQPASGK